MNRYSEQRWIRRPVRSRSKMVSFRVSLDELQELELEASRRHLSISDLMRLALARLLGSPPA